MTPKILAAGREGQTLSTEHTYPKTPDKMFPTFTKVNAELGEYSSPMERAFVEWMEVWKFTWDKKSGGKVVPAAKSIQHGDSIILPSPSSIQHGISSTPQTAESPCLAFRKEISSPPTLSSSSTSSSVFSFSSTASADTISEPPLFTTEFFEVLKSPKGGYGAFALKDIEVGTLILSEKPLFKAQTLTVYYEYEKLSREQRQEYNTLYGWKGLRSEPTVARFETNRFEINHNTGGIFIKSSRFNHACPDFKTCSYSYNESEDCLVVTAFRPIQKGQEITISYSPYTNDLYNNYGFRCDCPGCPDPAIAERNDRIMKGH